ncbi:MAG: hypothetical protein AB7D33_15815 [Sphingobium sp.]
MPEMLMLFSHRMFLARPFRDPAPQAEILSGHDEKSAIWAQSVH